MSWQTILDTVQAAQPTEAWASECDDGGHCVIGEHADRELTFAVPLDEPWSYFVARCSEFRRAGIAKPESFVPLARWLVGGAWPEMGLVIG